MEEMKDLDNLNKKEVKDGHVDNNNSADVEDPSRDDDGKTGCSQMWKDLEGDKIHVLVLFFLYILQGIPLGLRTSVPLILQQNDVAYKEQAKFSFASYPFSMKLLWAPIVDSVFIKKFGRRKSWLVPSQYLIGK